MADRPNNYQVIKFILVGILNTFVDLGILNILILASGAVSGLLYSAFKGVSFIAAVINSYFLNKFWTFKKKETRKNQREFTRFFVIAVFGFGINIGVASWLVNAVGPQFGLSPKIWANVGAVSATFVSMFWNFLGYKFFVFQK